MYLIAQVAQQCKENIYAINTLRDFQYFEDSKDPGLNVREKAKQLVALLKDEERLRNERAKALKAKERFAQAASAFGSDIAQVSDFIYATYVDFIRVGYRVQLQLKSYPRDRYVLYKKIVPKVSSHPPASAERIRLQPWEKIKFIWNEYNQFSMQLSS